MKRQDARNATGDDRSQTRSLTSMPPRFSRPRSRYMRLSDRDFSSLCTKTRSAFELGLRGLPHRRQVSVAVGYKGQRVGEGCLDLLVADRLVVELKAIDALAPIHWVQVRSYLKATGCSLGLLINFNVAVLLRGVKRVILTT